MNLRALFLSLLLLSQSVVQSFIMGKAANNLRRKAAEKAAKQAKIKAKTAASSIGTTRSSFREVVDSFEESDFHPSSFPLLGSNEHFQTIVGSESLRRFYGSKVRREFETSRERVETPDGDFFDIYRVTNCTFTPQLSPAEVLDIKISKMSAARRGSSSGGGSKGVVVLLHGLESSVEGALITKMAHCYSSKGYEVVLKSFRGCSEGEDNRKLGAYHLGFTDDLKTLVERLHIEDSSRKIYLSGFSLGGNVILKYLGEMGRGALELGVSGAVVTCVPFDPKSCQVKLDLNSFNRGIYIENFLSSLKRKAEAKNLRFPGVLDMDKLRAARTIGEFDEHFIARAFGFEGKLDYYEKCASKRFLSRIAVPSIAINARDDPFVMEEHLPTYEDVGGAPVRLVYKARGGHCGFLSSGPEGNYWLPNEMARAMEHIASGGK